MNQNQEEPDQVPLIDQFKQQMLKAWQPVPSLTKTIIMFWLLAFVFLGLGIPMIVLSSGIIEHTVRYDDRCSVPDSSCVVTLEITTQMAGPVFVYYELHGFYQNHRLYANSVSDSQLKGNTISLSDAQTTCSPIVTNADISVLTAIDGTALDPLAVANPCGMIAYSLFNDSFSLGAAVTIEDTNIAWPSDKQKYVMTNVSQMWKNTTDERFMNWMRIAALPDFRKLWGRIEGGLAAGNYTLTIDNQYDISMFKAQKYFVISQSNFFGSKNSFLSITYIVVGSVCLVIAIAFLVKKLMKKKKNQ